MRINFLCCTFRCNIQVTFKFFSKIFYLHRRALSNSTHPWWEKLDLELSALQQHRLFGRTRKCPQLSQGSKSFFFKLNDYELFQVRKKLANTKDPCYIIVFETVIARRCHIGLDRISVSAYSSCNQSGFGRAGITYYWQYVWTRRAFLLSYICSCRSQPLQYIIRIYFSRLPN